MSGVSDLNARQRMINMMYLVLLALLALNVSKEILKSFHLMEVSFENAKINIDEKNDFIMQSFDASMQSNQARTKEWYEKAKEVRKISKDFCDYVDGVKTEIESRAGGRMPLENGAAAGTLTELTSPDQMEKHANYFENEGHGKILQNAIEKARVDMIAVLNHPKIDKATVENLERRSALRADEPDNKGSNKQSWVSMYLVHSPLAGVTALLSKTENDAKNLEAEILNLLIKQIDAATIKFDAVEAKIIAPSSYIMQGSNYEAEIVLMALNTTAEPTIYVNGDKIPVEGGKGIYKVPASGAGVHQVKGYIEVEGPDGIEKKDFATEWQSFQPAATISAEAMNVLYIGLENPISVSVPGFRAEDVTVSAGPGCNLTKTTGTGKYIAKVQSVQGGKTKITASVKMPDGTSRQMGQMECRIRPVPNPEPLYGTMGSGAYGKGALMAQATLNASLGQGFAFEGVRFTVTRYTAMLSPKVGNSKIANVNGNSLAQVKSLISGAKAGDKLVIGNVEAKGPGGIVKKLSASLLIDIK